MIVRYTNMVIIGVTGADPGFQVRGGALKKITPSGGRRENCWVISGEKSRFYAKKIIFLPILGGRAPPLDPPLGRSMLSFTYIERDIFCQTRGTHLPIIVQTNCVFDSLHSVTTPLLGIVIYQTVVTLGSICISRSSLGV